MSLNVIKNFVETSKITFKDISEEWLAVKGKIIKKSTLYMYSYEINNYLINELQELRLKQLREYDYDGLIENLCKTLSAKTVKDIIRILKSILSYAELKYDCDLRIRRIVMPKENIEPIDILGNKEKRKLERYCLRQKTLQGLGIFMCLNTGLRIGEICALKWKNIDLEKKEVFIEHTLQRVYKVETKKTEVIIDEPKTRRSKRIIPISNKLCKELEQVKPYYDEEDFFLTGNKEKFIEPRCYRNTFKIILKKCKLKDYKFHILRHTFATQCIEVGMDVKALSEILGHANVEITLNKYVHSSYSMKRKFLEKI